MRLSGAAHAARIVALLAMLPQASCTQLSPGYQPAGGPDRATSAEGRPAPARSVASVGADPNRLIGADRAEITGLLGEPGFVRRDNAAQMWRYIDETCVLDIYLYAIAADSPDETSRVRHYDVRSRIASPVTPQACVRALLARAPSTS